MSNPSTNRPIVTLMELKSHAYCRRRAIFDAASLNAGDAELASEVLELQTLDSVGRLSREGAADLATLDRILSARRGSSWEGPEEILRETPFWAIAGPFWKEAAIGILAPALVAIAIALALA